MVCVRTSTSTVKIMKLVNRQLFVVVNIVTSLFEHPRAQQDTTSKVCIA